MIDRDTTEQPARWIIRAVTLTLFVYWLTLITATHIPRVPEPMGFRPSDKVVHLLAYAIFGGAGGAGVVAAMGTGLAQALGLWVLLAAHGILDEVTQPLVGRHADRLDWYADMLGAALGLSAVAAARLGWLRMRAGASDSASAGDSRPDRSSGTT